MAKTKKSEQQEAYDYIIVGSGAGGAPLAARLAEKGKRVLVLEAGPMLPLDDPVHEVTDVPAFHGVSTEHKELSWQYFVQHYDRLPGDVKPDPKYHETGPDGDPAGQGIFYPRATGVGGCTIHNAMITIAGSDADWDELANFVQDDSWRGNRMRGWFQKLENNNYLPPAQGLSANPIRRFWQFSKDIFWWVLGRNPDRSSGRHGFGGWLHTSVADISLGLGDRQLVGMLKAALWQAKLSGLDRAWTLIRRFLKGEISQALDPNHYDTLNRSPEGVVLIPISVCGKRTTIERNREEPNVRLGRRSGPRELLISMLASHSDNLVIRTDCLVERVLLNDAKPNPQAIGVHVRVGKNLYRASVGQADDDDSMEEILVKQGGEVILCAGTFNTPQLLMLSGIGDPDEFARLNAGLGKKDQLVCRVELPGVGKNLQDRYEVSVVANMKQDFSLLEGATFQPPENFDQPDPHLRQWRETGRGLYSSNGAVLGIFKRSRPDLTQPDLFMFGLPFPFKGYKIGYSDFQGIRNQFTWVILKSHSQNNNGTVRLRSLDPSDTPEINFNYFRTSPQQPGEVLAAWQKRLNRSVYDPDLNALVAGVHFVREILGHAKKHVDSEVHPGTPVASDDQIRNWIRSEAWGHHACGTCRMGRDGDSMAVLDSRFRVRNVQGLRVVDASIFPKIPGYFIVANIYMASEKAAHEILTDANSNAPTNPVYPAELRALEVDALKLRRKLIDAAGNKLPEPLDENGEWNESVTGLALSGGGIRSATFCLGVLQSMARVSLIRRIDIMSTVSGGGYIGGCLGRLFDRLRLANNNLNPQPIPPADQVEQEFSDSHSPTIDWLRKHGNYIAPQGNGDGRLNFAIFFRNLLSVQFVIGMAIFAIFGLANCIRYGLFDRLLAGTSLVIPGSSFPIGHWLKSSLGSLSVFLSPWFVLVEILFLFIVLPRIIGYWIVSQDRHESYKGIPLALLFLISGMLLLVGVATGLVLEMLILALAMLSSFAHVEMAWARGGVREAAVGSGGVETQRLRTRNYLTYDLGLALALTGVALVFALVDSTGHAIQQNLIGNRSYAQAFATLAAIIAALVPLARMLANWLAAKNSGQTSTLRRLLFRDMAAGAMALALFVLPLVFYSFAAHSVFGGGEWLWRGIAVTVFAGVVTLILASPSALSFANRSSLAQTYSARLARAYLGASNPTRRSPSGMNVTEVIPGDDVASLMDYRPHEASGPLHLINVMVNQTVDSGSGLRKRDRKGDNIAVSCLAMSVGEHAHSRWESSTTLSALPADAKKVPSRLVPLGRSPGMPHPLVDQNGNPADLAEMLSLRQWIGISGAAIDPGRGRKTNLGTSLLMGMVNLRTGHWWDSGIPHSSRFGFPDLSFMRRLLYLVPRVFNVQSLLLYVWIARYPGPEERFWHISDGGYFENSGAYELIRRRIPRIILCDGSADPTFEYEVFAELVRKCRIDFGASIRSFTPTEIAANVPSGLVGRVGALNDLRPEDAGKPSPFHAALCYVEYDNDPQRKSVILLLKSKRTSDDPIDVRHFHSVNPDFPNESTGDQFFDEAQWESYRKLGEHLATPVLEKFAWFWAIPVR